MAGGVGLGVLLPPPFEVKPLCGLFGLKQIGAPASFESVQSSPPLHGDAALPRLEQRVKQNFPHGTL